MGFAGGYCIMLAVERVVILMLENRSFDGYFGTFPGANGFYNNPQLTFANAWIRPAAGRGHLYFLTA